MDEQLKDMKLDDSLAENMTSESPNAGSSKDSSDKTTADNNQNANVKAPVPSDNSADTDACAETDNNVQSSSSVQTSSADTSLTPAQPVRPVSTGLPRIQRKLNEDREFSVILRARGREFSQALMTFAGTKQRSSRLWLTFGAMLIVISLLIIQVVYRHRELNLGYELSDAISQRESLLEENRKLRIELRVLSRRERLEPLAGKQLGMSTIQPEQVFIVDMDKLNKHQVQPGRRQDGLDNVHRIGEE